MPDGQHPVFHVWGSMVPGIGPAAVAFSQAVYDDSTLGLREFEAARLRIAQINGCLFCQDWRAERGGEQVEATFGRRVRRALRRRPPRPRWRRGLLAPDEVGV